MAIAFNCTGCGKHYEIGDTFAGKRGKCKQCGHMMIIPSPGAPAGPALKDIYGLDDEPAPAAAEPLAPLPPRAAAAVAEAAPPVKKKKEKSQGFFSFGSKARSEGDGGGRTMAFGLGGGGFVMLLFVVRVALRLGLSGFGLMSQSEMEGHITKDIASIRQMAAILRTAHDGATAESAVNEALPVFQKMIEHDRTFKDKKARKTDIEAVMARKSGEMQAAAAELRSELMRVAAIPGAENAVIRLASSMQEAAKDLPSDASNPFAVGMAGGGGPAIPQPRPPQLNLPQPQMASNPAPMPGFPPTPGPGPTSGPQFGPRMLGPRMR